MGVSFLERLPYTSILSLGCGCKRTLDLKDSYEYVEYTAEDRRQGDFMKG